MKTNNVIERVSRKLGVSVWQSTSRDRSSWFGGYVNDVAGFPTIYNSSQLIQMMLTKGPGNDSQALETQNLNPFENISWKIHKYSTFN